jgi:hypothetical protein
MKTINLIILTVGLTINSFSQEVSDSSYQYRVDNFLSTLSEKFSESTEMFTNSRNNDFTLETKVTSQWKRIITLKKKTSYKNDYDQVVYQRLFMGFLQFKDSENCEAAFKALLTCLGTDCADVDWGNELKGIKTTPFIFIKTETEIIFCKIYCEHRNEFWTSVKKDIKQTFGTPGTKTIEAGCGGPLKFDEIKK